MDTDRRRKHKISPQPKVHPDSPPSAWRRILALISTHNPFYLLSTAFVFHGSAMWMQSTNEQNTVLLIGLMAGYVLMMGITAIIVVRAGGVWEDARSILLLIPALLVELSLTLDDPLLANRPLGTVLVVAGFLFSAFVAEGLLWGLRIRLSVFFRIPLHAFLGALFLYPLVILPALESGDVAVARWRVFLFFPLVGTLLLTLLPAVRRGPTAVANHGTPWRWPLFPWTIFGVLVAGVCLRGYVLGLSFDPVLSLSTDAAMRLSSAWGAYFFVPVALALSILILEAGLVAGNRSVQSFALALTGFCVILALPWGPGFGPQAEFLTEFSRRAGSPLMLTLMASALFYLVAWGRRVRGAEPAFVMSLLLLTMVSPHGFGAIRLLDPDPLGLFLVGSVLLTLGVWKRESYRAFLGILLGVAALTIGPLAVGPVWVRGFVPFQLMVVGVFLLGRFFSDSFARWLCSLAAVGIFLGVVNALTTLLMPLPLVPRWAVPGYIILLISLAFAAAYPLKSLLYFWMGVAGFVVSFLELLRRSYLSWREGFQANGLSSFLMAFALFLIAAGISAAKAGLGQRLTFLLPTDRDNNGRG